MRNKLIVIDAGHGMGNRRAGVFDPGAVRYQKSQVPSPRSQVEATEAEFTLRYALALDAALRARGFETRLTRFDHKIPCSLQDRLEVARKNFAALLVSLHLNADPDPDGPKDPEGHGHEVSYRTASSAEVAGAISRALARHIPAHGTGVVCRAGLYVLQYDPSVLVELGFIDSDQDYALLADDLFKTAAMESVAQAIADRLNRPVPKESADHANSTDCTKEVQSPRSKVQSQSISTRPWTLDIGPWTLGLGLSGAIC